MRLLHIITGLNQGGAETALYRLVSASSSSVCHTVVSMLDEGVYGHRLRVCGVTVHTLNMPRGRLTPRGLCRLYRVIREARPDVVQTWMYHADMVGGLTARLAGSARVVWGIRHSNLDPEVTRASTRIVAKLSAWLSGCFPAVIVCNSEEAARVHQRLGYCADKLVVIPNGYDFDRFAPDHDTRKRVRREWSMADDELLIGMVARWDPQKDHANLLRALALLAEKGIFFRCALVGTGMDASNSTLESLIHAHGLHDRMFLVGPRDDIPAVMNALDVFVLSSIGEAFPNVVAEAMACGTPCVVTDVGDAALIVGDTGWVVPPSNPISLSDTINAALTTVASEGREVRVESCRARIAEHFSMERMVDAYMALWTGVVKKVN